MAKSTKKSPKISRDKFTIGRWEAGKDGKAVYAPNGDTIAQVRRTDPAEAQLANARLIAAAPDLLSAARDVIAAWGKSGLADAVRYLGTIVSEFE